MPMKSVACKAFALLAVSALGACESSTRLGSLLPESTARVPQNSAALPNAAPPPLTAAPAGDVESSTLAPPPGSGGAQPLPAPNALPSGGQTAAPAGSVGIAPGNLPPPPPSSAPQASLAPAAAPAAAPSRSSLTGNWSVTEAAGNRCKITLSSSPKLDLYGAGTNGCQSKDLQRVNAWELNGSDVILYEPGGAVAARLRSAGAGTYTGVTAKTGAPVTLTK